MTSLSAKDARVIIPSRLSFSLSDISLKQSKNVKFYRLRGLGMGGGVGPPHPGKRLILVNLQYWGGLAGRWHPTRFSPP